MGNARGSRYDFWTDAPASSRLQPNGIFEAGFNPEVLGTWTVFAFSSDPSIRPSAGTITIVESEEEPGGAAIVVPRYCEFTPGEPTCMFSSNVPCVWSLESISGISLDGISLIDVTETSCIVSTGPGFIDPLDVPYFRLVATPIDPDIEASFAGLGFWHDDLS